MEIDETILKAVKAAVKKTGSQLRFAQITGIKQQNISRYLNRQVTSINTKTWRLLFPYLVDFLPQDYINQLINTPQPPLKQLLATREKTSSILANEGNEMSAEERSSWEARAEFLSEWEDEYRRQEFELRSILNGYFRMMTADEIRKILELSFKQMELKELQHIRSVIYSILDKERSKKVAGN